MPELSIIVPVYKVEQYLPHCIESILAQTFTDFELILIDDGSPDNCGEICDAYALKDSRIRVIHQENQGVSAARNAGLDAATGEYIGFVDSDDWIDPRMYEQLIAKALEYNYDVVMCGMQSCNEDGSKGETHSGFGVYDSGALVKAVFGKPIPFTASCTNKIFRRNVIRGVSFSTEHSIMEDTIFLFNAFLKCKSGYQMPDLQYYILNRAQSAIRTSSTKTAIGVLTADLFLIHAAKQCPREVQSAAMDKYLDDAVRYMRILKTDSKLEDKRKYIVKIKINMLPYLIKAYFKCFLSKQKIHGYLYEILKA